MTLMRPPRHRIHKDGLIVAIALIATLAFLIGVLVGRGA